MTLQTIIVAAICIAICSLFWGTACSERQRKYDDMRKSYEQRIDELRGREFHQMNRCEDISNKMSKDIRSSVQDSAMLAGKNELYEKLLNKFLDEYSGTTDTSFIFEGRCYLPIEFEMHTDEESGHTLTVEFVEAPLEFRKVEKV